MAIYQPYFYIIQDLENLKYYAGCKYSKDADPATLLIENGYLTSSTTIHQIISQYGISRFSIRKIRVFNTGDEAFEYETRFLQKVNARINPRFYNAHCNNGVLPSYGSSKYKSLMIQKYGSDNPAKVESIQEKIKQTNLARYGVNHPLASGEIQDKIRNTMIEKYGVSHAWQKPEVRAKIDVKQRNKSISKTKSDPVWKETVGKEAIEKQLRSTDQVKKGLTVSETKSSIEWKEGAGKAARNKMKETLNDPAYRAATEKTCPHCGWSGYRSTYNRWHGNNCRQKNIDSGGA